MGTFLQMTQAGFSNSSKNSVSASLSPYRHQLGHFHDFGTRFKGWRRLHFRAMIYRSIADSKQLLTSFQLHCWITKASEKHSYIASQPRGHSREPMTYYRNLSVSRKNIEPGLNMPESFTDSSSRRRCSMNIRITSLLQWLQLILEGYTHLRFGIKSNQGRRTYTIKVLMLEPAIWWT